MPHNHVSHPEMITRSSPVAESLTPEKYAYLLSLLPTAESYLAQHNRFEASYAATLKGKDPDKEKACEEDRNALNQSLSILVAVTKAVMVKDPTLPEALGLARALEKTAAPAVALTEPHDFKAVYDPNGRLVVSVTRVPAAKGYQVWSCEGDPNIEANWKLTASSTNCKGIVITGLNRGKSNWLKVRAIRGNAVGPWSNYVSLSPS
jgi:hypothetical protein